MTADCLIMIRLSVGLSAGSATTTSAELRYVNRQQSGFGRMMILNWEKNRHLRCGRPALTTFGACDRQAAFEQRRRGDRRCQSLTGNATATFDDAVISAAGIQQAIEDCGHHCAGEVQPAHVSPKNTRRGLRRASTNTITTRLRRRRGMPGTTAMWDARRKRPPPTRTWCTRWGMHPASPWKTCCATCATGSSWPSRAPAALPCGLGRRG